MTSANAVRSGFLEFFQRHGHQIAPSAPLTPRNDPSLMFVNAGMVPFKNIFTGAEARSAPRVATAQKCLRAGGKHNDLENVGYTARHHTFFEMLGNFSFGDYFKEDAIRFAWTLTTKEFGVPPERLLVTVHISDEEAAGLWRAVAGLDDRRILRINSDDNFWRMGETGPCGPCTELFYDHGPGIPGGPPGSPDQDADRFVEIWNLVFMQYEQQTATRRIALPAPCIDTGMGLERIAAALQGVHNNYDSDLFKPLIATIADLTGVAADGPRRASHRVIADHVRAAAFLIADGVTPDNEGRGYVLRRILRRAMRHAHLLGARAPILHRILPTLTAEMGDHYQELRRAAATTAAAILEEEERFGRTLERGLRLLDDAVATLSPSAALPGEVAFTLYDTCGFPPDMTRDILRGQGRTLDEAGFEAAMAEQKARARRTWSGSGDTAVDALWFSLREQYGATAFTGYKSETDPATVLAIVRDGAITATLHAGENAILITDRTPFYAESGGQIGDAGWLHSAEGTTFRITDTQSKADGLRLHQGRLEDGQLRSSAAVTLTVDGAHRRATRAAHSATHLLHAALRRILGPHAAQKGSLVTPDATRFDFSHPRALTTAELIAVEALVNDWIRANVPITTCTATPEDAIAAGALALFGETYGAEARMVTMGGAADAAKLSIELCGGIHAARTGDIGLFHIVTETGVAAGVRRLDARVGAAALAHIAARRDVLTEIATLLNAPADDTPTRVAALLEERRRLERALAETRQRLALAEDGAAATTRTIDGVGFASRLLRGVPAKDLKPLADALKKRLGSGIAAVATVADGRVSVVVGVTDDLTDRFDAVALVRAAAAVVGGSGGGGRRDMAQAGGSDTAAAPQALAAIECALAADEGEDTGETGDNNDSGDRWP